ncbi:MAG TPA: glycoside hydrolase family 3 N-terminal domain-containing protein, partial [Casimicrobiaceae bacterium]
MLTERLSFWRALPMLVLTFAATNFSFAQSLPWMNPVLPPAQRAAMLVAAMTLDQKIEQIHGQPGPIPEVPSCGNGGRHVSAIPQLQIPTFRITNGPVGIGAGDCTPQAQATALPSSLALAATWDRNAAAAYGDLIGREAIDVGVHVVEGPGMNMLRVPQGGRNFEYLAEDPFLAGALATAEIKAIQNHGIIAMAKHFVANEQEANRMTVNEIIDARTLHEIYLLPFEMSVKDGDVAAVMCAYPRVNGTYNCENDLLHDTLRALWGFQGYV